MKMTFRNSAGEVGEIDAATMQPGMIVGGPATSLMERLNAAEREAMEAWTNEQQPGENGAVDLRKWPGWMDAFARAQRESKAGQ
ncbi:hypothetical protein [Burkholderia stabilis]|uniref:hypothetical protein n=1 Tax=Burkholderia stabilis TaxID=95485 RepID=UPI001591DEB9|nr:hypothetical protein [Burkholderia stabilis]